MPWEKTFDLDEATDKAISVFWQKGYEATSISDLVEGMEINKGSLYNAFGSKKALFDRALLRYDQKNRQKSLRELEAMADPALAIAALFDGLIAEAKTDVGNRGCLLVNTALEFPNQSADVQNLVTSALHEFEAFFKRMIVQGQKQGGIPADVDADAAARSMLALVVGLRVLARGTYDAEALRVLKAGAMKLIS
ncbi:TetR family transcriptional regulator C-terminal domain-containing protein [Anderseniella sp. Alg231-50]|uniref:TetR family transcriptional regulator C-terminal domain-containing protein n=1 Tax=Anderseniella sp. Alg231-50 TaxID=1922226 RepID=UPI000D559610